VKQSGEQLSKKCWLKKIDLLIFDRQTGKGSKTGKMSSVSHK
jgi:hypothetical protein